MKCKECKYFIGIQSAAPENDGICTRPESYAVATSNMDCPYEPKSYTCADCNHFTTNDYACMTAQADDDATQCCGFVDNKYVQLVGILFDWKQRGFDCKALFEQAFEEANNI